MKPNMNRPHRRAMMIHPSSTLAIGSFHQTLFSGGCDSHVGPFLVGERNGSDFHNAPNQVKGGRDDDAQKQKQERIVQGPVA